MFKPGTRVELVERFRLLPERDVELITSGIFRSGVFGLAFIELDNGGLRQINLSAATVVELRTEGCMDDEPRADTQM